MSFSIWGIEEARDNYVCHINIFNTQNFAFHFAIFLFLFFCLPQTDSLPHAASQVDLSIEPIVRSRRRHSGRGLYSLIYESIDLTTFSSTVALFAPSMYYWGIIWTREAPMHRSFVMTLKVSESAAFLRVTVSMCYRVYVSPCVYVTASVCHRA